MHPGDGEAMADHGLPSRLESRSSSALGWSSGRGFVMVAAVLAVLFVWALRADSQSDLLVGYATIVARQDSTLPASTALFSFRNQEGVLVSEAGVAAVEPLQRGRIFVDSSIPTGLALANPSAVAVRTTLTLRDSSGSEVEISELTILSGQHQARFLSELELFGELPDHFVGSVTFETEEEGLGALTIRQGSNRQGAKRFSRGG